MTSVTKIEAKNFSFRHIYSQLTHSSPAKLVIIINEFSDYFLHGPLWREIKSRSFLTLKIIGIKDETSIHTAWTELITTMEERIQTVISCVLFCVQLKTSESYKSKKMKKSDLPMLIMGVVHLLTYFSLVPAQSE